MPKFLFDSTGYEPSKFHDVHDFIVASRKVLSDYQRNGGLFSLSKFERAQYDRLNWVLLFMDDLLEHGSFFDFGLIENSDIIDLSKKGGVLISDEKLIKPPFPLSVMRHKWTEPAIGKEVYSYYFIGQTGDGEEEYFVAELREIPTMRAEGAETTMMPSLAMTWNLDADKPGGFVGEPVYISDNTLLFNGFDSTDIYEDTEKSDRMKKVITAEANSVMDPIASMLYILSIKDVESVFVEAPVKLNKQRIKKGKSSIKDCLVIDTSFLRTGYSEGPTSKSSPKPHIRRGHLRNLGSGKVLWIRDALVNFKKEDNGTRRSSYRKFFKVNFKR